MSITMSITGVAVQTRRTECGVVLGMDLCLYTSWRLGAFFVGAVEVQEAYSASLTECLKVFNNTPPSVLKEYLTLQGFSKKSLQVFSESIFNTFLRVSYSVSYSFLISRHQANSVRVTLL